ncbi:unnamed protein product [Leptosia nina]|uniref:CCHC-type domain-containing protein n=1 Tax=Leptosia nina TaxID=320188 RepID=A0AAV1JVH7_9NEOP
MSEGISSSSDSDDSFKTVTKRKKKRSAPQASPPAKRIPAPVAPSSGPKPLMSLVIEPQSLSVEPRSQARWLNGEVRHGRGVILILNTFWHFQYEKRSRVILRYEKRSRSVAIEMEPEQVEEILRRKERELELLEEMTREAGFTPRASLRRSPPPSADVVPLVITPVASSSKRKWDSPEELEEELRRRVRAAPVRGTYTPPLGGHPRQREQEAEPVPATPTEEEGAEVTMTVGQKEPTGLLVERANKAGEALMAAASSSTSKLNKADIAAIGTQVQRLTAIVATLGAKLGEERLRAHKLEGALAQASAATTTGLAPASAPTIITRYADVLRVGGGATKPKPVAVGKVLAFYPKPEAAESLKTADDTKAALKSSLDPRALGVREPKARNPLVAVVAVEGRRVEDEAFLKALRTQNFPEQESWAPSDVRIAFKKNARGGSCTTVVLECSPSWGVGAQRVYVEWERYLTRDFADTTCCAKCQAYGHAARFCRAAADVCGKCGEEGHRSSACEGSVSQCATCKRAGKEAASHRTASAQCPARQAAERRSFERTNYGV